MEEDFLERHRSAVFSRLRRWTVNDAEAEDLTQETLLRAHRKLHTLDDREAALAWLFRIADRLRIDHHRRRDPLNGPTVEWKGIELPDEAPTVLERAVRSEMSDCTRNYVERLKPSHRQVLRLHDEEGRSAKEIAAALGVSEGAVKVRLHRARSNLRGLLKGACRFSRDERGIFVCEPKPSPSTERAAGKPYLFPELSRPLGKDVPPTPKEKTVMMPKEKELIAVAVSVAAGCEPCTEYHVKAARDNGAGDDDLARMIETALCVRERATQRMASVAWKELGKSTESPNCGCSEPPSRLVALASAASALAANCGSGVGGFLELARRAGADERDGQVALGIARQIKKVAAEKAEAASRGEAGSASPCGCAAATAESKESSACC